MTSRWFRGPVSGASHGSGVAVPQAVAEQEGRVEAALGVEEGVEAWVCLTYLFGGVVLLVGQVEGPASGEGTGDQALGEVCHVPVSPAGDTLAQVKHNRELVTLGVVEVDVLPVHGPHGGVEQYGVVAAELDSQVVEKRAELARWQEVLVQH